MLRWVLPLLVLMACVASTYAPTPAAEPDIAVRDYVSPDKTRFVRVSGEEQQAVLVDGLNKEPAWMVLLSKHTVGVKFRKAGRGALGCIELKLSEGSTVLYELDGTPIAASR